MMYKRHFRFVCIALALCFSMFSHASAPTSHTPQPSAHPDRIRYDGSCLTIEGKDVFVYSAAFHYFRCPEALWRKRFQQIKEAGFNTVETYVPWNWHERTMPHSLADTTHFDFADLKRWLKMAHNEFGLYTIVRPGPFICAEFSGGAYPRWLAKFRPAHVKGLWLRSADATHIKWCTHWFDGVCKALADEQLTRKPKNHKGIIMIQIENEYNAHGCEGKERFLKELYRSVRRNGFDIPVFTCLTSECRNSQDPELSQVFDCDNYYVGLTEAPSCAHRMADLRRAQPHAPGFVTELQGGWFSLVTGRLSEDHYSDARHFQAVGLMSILGGATGLNYYMFFGGTHLAGWGARGMTTTYDYNAAIHESGRTGAKYDAAQAIGRFLRTYGHQLTRAEGGPCKIAHAPQTLFGGVRIAADGTRFVFLHNTDASHPLQGKATLMPGRLSKPSAPMYNIDQNGQKVLIASSGADTDSLTLPPLTVSYNLPPLGSKVLVIPAGKQPQQGTWWPMETKHKAKSTTLPNPVRITHAQRHEDDYAHARWMLLPQLVSLSDMDVNDFRYSLYRSRPILTAQQARDERFLLFHMFTRDIVSVSVNGQQAKRLFPDKADAQSWPTRNCFEQIQPDEYDNRFDVTGLLHEGENEIVVVYENLGHAHGYVPMEELSGIRQGGLSVTESALSHPLQWEFARDAAGITAGWHQPTYSPEGWKQVTLDTTCEIPHKGNGIQPKSQPDGLLTWYRIEFELPASSAATSHPWLVRLCASGNGYMWLNGHNIGRHWEAGPQREYYLPECWLHFGKGKKNVLVLGLRQTANGATLQAMEIAPYPALP